MTRSSNKEPDSRTIYTFCKSLNYIESTSYLYPYELKDALRTLIEVLEGISTVDLFYMRGTILLLNTILLQEDLSQFNLYSKRLVNIMPRFDFTNESAAMGTLSFILRLRNVVR